MYFQVKESLNEKVLILGSNYWTISNVFSGERISQSRPSPAGPPADGHGLVRQPDRLRREPAQSVDPPSGTVCRTIMFENGLFP